MNDELTPDDQLEAFRTAVAIARAGAQGDAEGVDVLLRNSPLKAGAIYELSRLPGQLAEGAFGRFGQTIDIDAALADLLQALPQTMENA